MASFITRRRMLSWLALLAVIVLVVGVGAPDAGAAAEPPSQCAQYGVAPWQSAALVAGVTVETAGIAGGVADRFAAEVADVATDIAQELAPLDGVTVCIVAPDVELPNPPEVPAGQNLQALAHLDEGSMIVVAREVASVRPAVAFGLAHIALWRAARERALEDGFPEPQATVIAHWYRARASGRLPLHHAAMRSAALFNPNPTIPWSSGIQEPVLRWNPPSNDSPISDLVDFVAEHEGVEALMVSDPEVWTERERTWKTALRTELLGTSSTREWLGGLGLVALLLAAAAMAAYLEHRRRRRSRSRRPTPPPIPGFFEGLPEEPVPSTAAGAAEGAGHGA